MNDEPLPQTSETPPVETLTAESAPAEQTPAPPPPFVQVEPTSDLRVVVHLPQQRRAAVQKINGCFLYTDKFGRFDREGRHILNDGGMHLYQGRLLTVQEFQSEAVTKILTADSLAVRPLIRIVRLCGDALESSVVLPAPAAAGPSIEEIKEMLTTIDTLRLQNEEVRLALSEERSKVLALEQGLRLIEQQQDQEPGKSKTKKQAKGSE
jgi:hypothetical protein